LGGAFGTTTAGPSTRYGDVSSKVKDTAEGVAADKRGDEVDMSKLERNVERQWPTPFRLESHRLEGADYGASAICPHANVKTMDVFLYTHTYGGVRPALG
jgi:phage tail sheath protein FI